MTLKVHYCKCFNQTCENVESEANQFQKCGRCGKAFYCSPKRSNLEPEKDSLSPRLGLPKRKRRPCQPIRYPHTIVMPPNTKIGDLTGNAALFLEMRPFDMRKSDTLFPERQWRERGGTYYTVIRQ